MKDFAFTVLLLMVSTLNVTAQITGTILDATDDSPLPFATIIGPKTYAIANEEGRFTYKGKVGDLLEIGFLGFRDTILHAHKDMTIRMINDGILSDAIVITDANYISPYRLFMNAKNKYKSLDHKVVPSKLFVKRESKNNGVWSNQTETLYNAKQHKGKIYDLTFQHGKSYVNEENDLIFTLDLLTVMQEEEIFSKYSKYLYTSAGSLGSAKKIKKRYQGNYREWQSNGQSYFIVDTKSKNENKFDTELTISADDFDLIRLRQRIIKPNEAVFRTLNTNAPVDLDSLSIEYIFEDREGQKLISTIAVAYSFEINGIHSENTINLKFFDFEEPYFDLISSIDYDLLTDYQRLWNTPYNNEFWNGQKLTFSKLDTLSSYEEMNLNTTNTLLNKRYLTIPDVNQIGVAHFAHTARMDDGVGAMIKFNAMDMKTQRHVHANLFAHYYVIDNKPHATIQALVDHQRSFIMRYTPMMDSMFMKEIRVVEALATKAETELKSIDLLAENNPYKTIQDLIKRYNKLIKEKLSTMDAHQNRDWSATAPDPKEIYRTRFGRRVRN